MNKKSNRYAPGRIRDAVLHVLSQSPEPLTVREIEKR